MNAASEQRASLEAEAHKTLTLNEHYTTLKAEADDLQRKFDGNEAWLERYVAMADEQLKLFQADKKFMYLVNSGYDPANRGKRGLKAIFDDRVARSVNFEENKDHYDKLISRPKEMKEELDRRRAALDEKLTELRGIEKGVEDQLGLTPLLEAGDKVDAKRKDAMDRLSQHDADYEALVTKLAELDTVNSPFYIKAKEDLKLFLRGQKISDLLEMARKTPSPEDDNLVQRLGEIDEAEKKIKGGASGLIAERESWNEKLANLKRLEAAFCKKDFESYRSVFVDDFNIEQLLNYYIAGQKNPSTGQAYTVDDIWMEVQEHHRLNAEEQPRYNPSYPSSYPVPRVGPVIMVPGVGGHRSPPPRPHDWGSSSGPHSSPSPRPSSPSRPSSPRPSSPSPRPSSPTHFGGSSGGRIGGFSSSGGGRVGGFGKH